MDSKRRHFIRQSSLLSGAFFLTEPFQALQSASQTYFGVNSNQVNIIHSNDLHNRLESGLRSGYGGMTNIQKSLSKKKSHLLLDAGDFLDKSASYADHKKMISRMNDLGYAAATLGNHELANGLDYFASLLALINFSLVNCNYSFEHSLLCEKVKSFTIVKTSNFKIGVTGVGVVNDEMKKHLECRDAYESANRIGYLLKHQYDCDIVVCLSHLGYKNIEGAACNVEFAEQSENIDLIISGHGKAVMPSLNVLRNRKKEEVMISHAAPEGLLLKQITITFNDLRIRNNISCKSILPGLPDGISAYEAIGRITA